MNNKLCDRLIWVFISIYVLVFSYICFLKYQSFSYYNWDFASDIAVLYNSVHGRLFYYPFLEHNILGLHTYLVVLLLIPIYALIQHPVTLLVLQSLFLGLSAYPLYKLAKLRLSKAFALLVSLSYLLYPALGFINIFETHFEIYAVFFLFFALFYFEKEKFNKFLAFIILAIICKENISLIVFMFGIYALIRRRSKRWILVPLVLGFSYFVLAIKFIIPYFLKDAKLNHDSFIFSIYYRHLGDNMFDVIKTIILDPITTVKCIFAKRNILYFIELFMPTGFLALISPIGLLIALPIFMQNLLSAVNIHTSIYYHYTALLIPFIFYSTINGLSRLLKYRFIYNKQKALKISIFTVVIVSGVYLAGPQFYLLEYLSLYRVDEAAMQKDRLVKMVPNDASVIATFQFLPKLASRQEIYSMHFISRGLKMLTNERYEAPMSLEYALIDFNEPLLISNFFRENSPNNIYSFLKDGNWRVLERVDDIVLFKKDYPEGEELFELVNQNSYNIQNRIDINIGDRIALLGYDYNAYLSEDRMLDLSYYWRLMDKIERPIGLLIYFLDGAGNIVFTKSHSIGYRLFNMEHKFIKENHKIFIPHNIKKGVYKVRLGFFYLDNNSLLPILDKDLIDKTGRIILEDILI